MPYLIAKIAVMLLLAALLGAWLATWRMRRSWQDVSTEYESLRTDWASWRNAVEQRLAAPTPTADLVPVEQRLGSVEAAVRAIVIPKPASTDLSPVLGAIAAIRIPSPERVDLDPIGARLQGLEQAVRGLRIPEPEKVDLTPVVGRLGALETRLTALRMPDPPSPVDLGPVVARLEALDQRVGAITFPPAKDPDLSPALSRLDRLAREVQSIAMPAPADLSGLTAQLRELDARIASITFPEPAPVELAPLETRLAGVEAALGRIVIPAPREPDLSELHARFSTLEQRVAGIQVSEAPSVDLRPMQTQLAALGAAVTGIRIPPPAAGLDLGPTQERLARVEQALRAIVIPQPREPDLSRVLDRLQELEQRIASIRMPHAAPAADLTPVLARLDALQVRLQETPAAAPAAPPLVRSGSRNLLERPAYGEPDDLKRIKGVAGVLERLLHGIGVYYFWQIGEWSAADVGHVDSQLTAFKGRITRDEWVAQARALMREDGAARRPELG